MAFHNTYLPRTLQFFNNLVSLLNQTKKAKQNERSSESTTQFTNKYVEVNIGPLSLSDSVRQTASVLNKRGIKVYGLNVKAL